MRNIYWIKKSTVRDFQHGPQVCSINTRGEHLNTLKTKLDKINKVSQYSKARDKYITRTKIE